MEFTAKWFGKKGLLALFALLPAFGAQAQLTCNKGYNCGPCNSAQQAYTFTGLFCVACSGWCKWFFAPEGDEKALMQDAPEGTLVPMEGGIYRALLVPQGELVAISGVNMWAAGAIMTLSSLAGKVDLSHGSAPLSSLPTSATIDLATTQWSPEQLLATGQPVPSGVNARVGWTMARTALRDAELRITSYVADDEGRVLYRVYPDVVLQLNDPSSVTASLTRDKTAIADMPFALRSWTLAE